MARQTTAQEEISHFESIPWCRRHLQPPPGTELVVTPAYSRARKAGTSEDALFSQTINGPAAISHFVLLYPRPADTRAVLSEVRGLLTLGAGLDGHPGICHGGIVAAVFDEVLGYAAPGGRPHEGAAPPVASFVTAYLHTTYLRPVRTPGTVLVSARTTKVQGRKIYVEGSMEDGEGRQLARAETLFVEMNSKL